MINSFDSAVARKGGKKFQNVAFNQDNINLNRSSTSPGGIDNPFVVKNLPPNFMKTCQSLKAITTYKTLNITQKLFDLSKKLGTNKRTLDESLCKHTVKSKEGKERNMLIENRVLKYQQILVDIVAKKPSKKELDTMISKRLLIA